MTLEQQIDASPELQGRRRAAKHLARDAPNMDFFSLRSFISVWVPRNSDAAEGATGNTDYRATGNTANGQRLQPAHSNASSLWTEAVAKVNAQMLGND